MPSFEDHGRDRLRVHFIHGLEGSPQGLKARYLAARFDTLTPDMDTGDFRGCIELHARLLAQRTPEVLVGSSFGGAVAVALLQRGAYRGPTLLLAPAARKLGLPMALPGGVPVYVVHGTRDTVIDLEDSRRLAASAEPDQVRLLEVDDTHGLASLVADDRLADLVVALSQARQKSDS
jgi:pimeloyl-ACP methyl ester carboxylesterase